MNTHPHLTLIGAGPGDPELITLKGIKALQNARVILYDALVDDRLLDYAPSAIKVFVGKRANNHTYSQEAIHRMIVQYAYEYGHVVRLKGGDPFVFGRGTEEIHYAAMFGIHVSVIPGITSALSVPAAIGIPATERGIAEGVWIITGTTSNGTISSDIRLAAQSNSTVVILMGTRNLNAIVAAFKQANKHHLPIAIIQNGTTAQQREVLGCVDTIEQLARDAKIGAPAIIIAGEVVRNSALLQKVVQQHIHYN